MQRKDLKIGEEYNVRLPVRNRYREHKPSTLLSIDEPMLGKSGKPVMGVKVENDGTEYIIHSRDVRCTWDDLLAENKQHDEKAKAYENWQEARESEIKEAHLTLCALLQNRGIEISEEFERPRDEYSLTPAQIVELLGGDIGQIAESTIRPRRQPKEIQMPEVLTAKEIESRMTVLKAVQDEINRWKERNADPEDVGYLVGADRPIFATVLEIARTDAVIMRCDPMPAYKVKKEITALSRSGYIYSFSNEGWKITPAGARTLEEL